MYELIELFSFVYYRRYWTKYRIKNEKKIVYIKLF